MRLQGCLLLSITLQGFCGFIDVPADEGYHVAQGQWCCKAKLPWLIEYHP